jgi:tripartite-type tricarboxylate transporter receptor subunit TctC
MMITRRLLAGTIALLALSVTVRAEYPDHPVTMIVPLAAGGGTDVAARIVAKYLETEINGPVVVLNKTGAAGEIGLTALATARPDGYTIGIVNTPGIISIPLERKTRFDINSFQFLVATTYDPVTISVLDTSPIKSVPDLIAKAKKDPGGITVGTQGAGSVGDIAIRFLEHAANIKLQPIPYTGSSSTRASLLSGDINAVAITLGEALAFSEGGRTWRVLAVMAPERNLLAPSIPTFKEFGYDLDHGSLRGFAGPKGMPEEVVRKLTEGLHKVVDNPEFVERSLKTFQPVKFVNAEEYMKLLHDADQRLRALWAVNPWNR